MGYAQGSYKGTPVWVGALVAVVLISRCAVIGGGFDGSAKLRTEADVERALFRPAETGRLYQTIKRTHPREFAELTQQVLAHARDGKTSDQIDDAIMAFLMRTTATTRHDIAQAPHAAFARYREAEIKVMERLQATDAGLCASYVMTGQLRTPKNHPASGAHLVDFNIATWEASAAGRDTPVAREVGAPTPATWRRLEQAMRGGGLKPASVSAFFGPRGLQGLPAAEQCAVGLGFTRAVHALPGEQADGFYAFLIERDA